MEEVVHSLAFEDIFLSIANTNHYRINHLKPGLTRQLILWLRC